MGIKAAFVEYLPRVACWAEAGAAAKTIANSAAAASNVWWGLDIFFSIKFAARC